jgi:hypothetical protein
MKKKTLFENLRLNTKSKENGDLYQQIFRVWCIKKCPVDNNKIDIREAKV